MPRFRGNLEAAAITRENFVSKIKNRSTVVDGQRSSHARGSRVSEQVYGNRDAY